MERVARAVGIKGNVFGFLNYIYLREALYFSLLLLEVVSTVL